jgi:hypothetical protein
MEANSEKISAQDVIELFDGISAMSRPTTCSECGTLLVFQEATFFLLGSEKSWTIQLPFCPRCK